MVLEYVAGQTKGARTVDCPWPITKVAIDQLFLSTGVDVKSLEQKLNYGGIPIADSHIRSTLS